MFVRHFSFHTSNIRGDLKRGNFSRAIFTFLDLKRKLNITKNVLIGKNTTRFHESTVHYVNIAVEKLINRELRFLDACGAQLKSHEF